MGSHVLHPGRDAPVTVHQLNCFRLHPSHFPILFHLPPPKKQKQVICGFINLDTIHRMFNVRPIPGQRIYSIKPDANCSPCPSLATINPHHPEYQLHQKLSASGQKMGRIRRDHPKHQLHKVWHQASQSGLALA